MKIRARNPVYQLRFLLRILSLIFQCEKSDMCTYPLNLGTGCLVFWTLSWIGFPMRLSFPSPKKKINFAAPALYVNAPVEWFVGSRWSTSYHAQYALHLLMSLYLFYVFVFICCFVFDGFFLWHLLPFHCKRSCIFKGEPVWKQQEWCSLHWRSMFIAERRWSKWGRFLFPP